MSATRVLFVLGALEPGGIQTYLLTLLRHFRRDEVAIDVCTMASASGRLTREVKALGAEVFTTRGKRSPWTNVDDIRQVLRRKKYDALHANRSSSFFAPAIVAARRENVPVRIAHYHGVHRKGSLARDLAEALMRRSVLRDATHLIGVSRTVLDSHFPNATDGRMRVCHNPVDGSVMTTRGREGVRAEFGLRPDDIVIGHSGRFFEAKNQSLIVDLAVRIAPNCSNVYFLLAGDGPSRSVMQARVNALNLQDRVYFAGWREDVPAVLSAMDVFLFPSLWEGCPIALLEAQAAGLPCVVSNIPACAEILAPGLAPFMFSPTDVSVAQKNLTLLITDESLRTRLGGEARLHAQRFDIATTAPIFQAIYQGRT